MKKNRLIATLFLLAHLAGTAQQVIPCHTMEQMEILSSPGQKGHEERESWFKMMSQLNELAKTQATETTGSPRIIPTVFHIIHVGGNENISDAQILDQMRSLNEDFRRLNADTTNTPSPFKPLGADCNIEFRLAQKDPNGNCTDGIVRVYSPLSVNARDNVKAISYWPSNKYLNVWVVKSINTNGSPGVILGYAQFPGFGPATTDGVVIRHDVCGSIGTVLTGPFSNNKGRTLTHEVGHWLGLRHIWGDATCGNDNVSDTPPHVTANNGCPPFPHNPNNSCGGGPNGEMYSNYMDYTDGSCQNIFTLGQSSNMTLVLNSIRTNIWSASNLTATGTDGSPAVTCAPTVDFYPWTPVMICAGDSIQLKDMSFNGQPTSRSWTTTGGSPSSSTDSMPWVRYTNPGTYTVSLTVSNSAGSSSTTRNGVVIVNPTTATYSNWMFYEGFENGNIPSDWAVINASSNTVTWTYTTVAAWEGNASVRIQNASNLSGHVDELVTPGINLSVMNTPKVYFHLAYAQRSGSSNDKLRVLVSTDCGKTWVQRYLKSGSVLSTVTPTSGNFTPTSPSQWRMETVNLSTVATATNALIKFEFTSDGGNNIYIDNINLSGPLGENENSTGDLSVSVFPNPASGEFVFQFENNNAGKGRIFISDITGREISELYNGSFSENFTRSFSTDAIPAGIYLVGCDFEGGLIFKKLIIK
jgi:PKD repeat protein